MEEQALSYAKVELLIGSEGSISGLVWGLVCGVGVELLSWSWELNS